MHLCQGIWEGEEKAVFTKPPLTLRQGGGREGGRGEGGREGGREGGGREGGREGGGREEGLKWEGKVQYKRGRLERRGGEDSE